MSGYNYKRFISDFGERTIDNQKRIDELRTKAQEAGLSKEELNARHHEVTQLINSLFGLLIVPYEKYKYDNNDPDNPNSMREYDLRSVKEYYDIVRMIIDLEKDQRLYNDYNDRYLVSGFLRHMRNSLAHSGKGGLQFTPIDKNKEISKIIFYDQDAWNHQFCVELLIRDVRKLSELLSKMYKELENTREIDDLPIYDENLKKYESLLTSKSNPRWAQGFEKDGKRSSGLNRNRR